MNDLATGKFGLPTVGEELAAVRSWDGGIPQPNTLNPRLTCFWLIIQLVNNKSRIGIVRANSRGRTHGRHT